MEKQILEILERNIKTVGFRLMGFEKAAAELSSLMSADLRKELIKPRSIDDLKNRYKQYCKEKSTKGYISGWHASEVWRFLETELFDFFYPDSKALTDKMIEKLLKDNNQLKSFIKYLTWETSFNMLSDSNGDVHWEDSDGIEYNLLDMFNYWKA